MTAYLQRDRLLNLVNGRKELLEKFEKEAFDKEKLVKEYEKNMEKYEKQDLRMQKSRGTLQIAMTDIIANRYYNKIESTTGSSISLDVQANYQTTTSYDSNYLQRELYKSTLEELGSVLEHINHIQELRDKLVMYAQTLSYADSMFHILEGVLETPE